MEAVIPGGAKREPGIQEHPPSKRMASGSPLRGVRNDCGEDYRFAAAPNSALILALCSPTAGTGP
jgi:hypothetical protein